MPRPDATTYLTAISRESARFAAALREADPAARVPACPDWDAADLLWHLTEVQWFWSEVVTHRPAGPPDDDRRPTRADSWAGLHDQHATHADALVRALGAADPEEPAWSWAGHVPDGQTVGFTFRRQAHEALVHRLDAEQTAGPAHVTPLDPTLAADGVAELLEVMYGGDAPAWGRIEPGPHLVRVDLTDVGTSLWARPCTFLGTDPESGRTHDGPHVLVVEAPGDGTAPSAVVSGTAEQVDVAWWKRGGTEALAADGDPQAHAALRAALDPPLD
ncbi:maleylpyruvate isomerase N-terminal domain-containing protein [Nocardioides litoris]|uniref:maleylpyruvate isomerase N-terminal domain-containing protein n=1 Tax=Nocardioides litoris TaxID=1926648 RepID=UPI001120156C|nr:maleylpyruvate isomerase N-terminal domain-containing protein [Nocardioides litoris]